MSESQRVHINILEKDYQIACPPNERDALHRAAEELDERMRVIRSSGNVIGMERIAVMAALNLCYELQQSHGSEGGNLDSAALERITKKLNKALEA
ncbi:cell division protein ZapA [Teredinibacter waterburyi]|uniref:cell division protein ZapA n=1 Tax=Teredinibacter waterburyi TaxID=1500538 RepID=UPI00165FDF64|nr:cell division protein ZapA [Teredinibacter waterburyi]